MRDRRSEGGLNQIGKNPSVSMKISLDRRFRGRRIELLLAAQREQPRAGSGAPLTGAALTGVYLLRRLGRRSGLAAGEATAALPGDEIVASPIWQSTRAITISAPAEQVWPWIVQMGFPSHRAGWYTPHWLDRLTFGIQERSADRIVAELQHLEAGDRVPDSADGSTFFTAAIVDPPHTLVLHSTRHVIKPIRTIDFSWAFVVRDVAPGTSRLLIRARSSYTPRWALPFVELVIGPADFVNAGAMLRGIKRRVEQAAAHPKPPEAYEPTHFVDTGEPRLAERFREVGSR